MILGYLLLAHLLADFILQPRKLVLWKMKDYRGVMVHASVHFFVNLLILLPMIVNGYYWLIGVAFLTSFIHFWIDEAKISYDLKHDHKVIPFLIDQLMHLLTILLVFFFISKIQINLPENGIYAAYQDIKIIAFLGFLILVSSTVDIYYFQKLREKNSHAQLKINVSKMLTRIIVLCLLYGLFMLLSFYARGNDVF